MMAAAVRVELKGQPYEIVTVPCHQTATLYRSCLQLLEIGSSLCSNLVGADCIDPQISEAAGNLRAEILVQIEFQNPSGARVGCLSVSRSFVHASLRAI